MSKIKDELGFRMKEYYENRAKTKLLRREPVAIRIDGRHFHSFCKNFKKPFDEILIKSMQDTMLYLCKNIQGCVLGYTQSDEITLILTDYKKLTSEAFFDYDVQKVCSITASMATMAFNKAFEKNVKEWRSDTSYIDMLTVEENEEEVKLAETYLKAIETGAMFDSRCFNIPKEEVTNLVYWRQHDASKNSVSMAARAYFSHKEVQDKNTSEMQEMLFSKHGINWNNYPTVCKRGSSCIKQDKKWIIDEEIPIFKGDDREYVERFI